MQSFTFSGITSPMEQHRAVVIGVGGSIGSKLAEYLLNHKFTVCGIDTSTSTPRWIRERNIQGFSTWRRFSLYEGNLTALPLDEIIKGARFVFYVPEEKPDNDFYTSLRWNVIGTERILQTLNRIGGIEKFIYGSTGNVYPYGVSTEETQPQPTTVVEYCKIAGEELIHMYAREQHIPALVVRYSTVYGPHEPPWGKCHRILRDILEGKDVDQKWQENIIYIDDAVEATFLLAQSPAVDGVFNIAGKKVVSADEVKTQAKKFLKMEREDANKDGNLRVLHTEKLEKLVGFTPRFPLHQGIAREINWLREVYA